jgi:RNA polymerase sigma-70 factor (ECF subfamily)
MSADEHPNRATRDAEDALVMARIRAGDDSALAVLYDRYATLALGMALKIIRDQSEAEDVVHDAFIAVVERVDQFRADRGSLVAWLVTMVRNLALDRARRRTRRAQILDEELRHEPPLPAPDPEQISWSEREREAVRGAMSKLSASQRETLEIAFFEGLSYPEIAARENVALGTVKSRAARALGALRAALDGTIDADLGPPSE